MALSTDSSPHRAPSRKTSRRRAAHVFPDWLPPSLVPLLVRSDTGTGQGDSSAFKACVFFKQLFQLFFMTGFFQLYH